MDKLISDTPPRYRRTDRTTLKRKPGVAQYDKADIHEILDAGFMCHVAYQVDDSPYVTSTAYWREGDYVYWHGSGAGRMLQAQKDGIPVCFSVAHLDGLVMARSAFHHSVNYRSVTAFGVTELVEGADEKRRQLELFMERIAPGRWDEVREPSARELRLTTIVRLELDEVVAKCRAGDPVDDEADYSLPVWAGVVPIEREVRPLVDDSRLAEGIEAPGNLSKVRID